MRVATAIIDGRPCPLVSDDGQSWAPILDADDLMHLIALGPAMSRQRLELSLRAVGPRYPDGELVFTAPYRHPHKIWGIGLNYAEHAADLHESRPSQPGSFIKGDHTITGADGQIVLPRTSTRTTAEGELGLVFGQEAFRIPGDADPFDWIFGVTAILDQTAEDILEQNPRYLTRSKNFPTFFAFGPVIVTLDEFLDNGARRIEEVVVRTEHNGRVHRQNDVQGMLHGPRDLIRFHSEMMPLHPGDIISTGTPGAVVIQPGDVAGAIVDGLPPLRLPVVADPC